MTIQARRTEAPRERLLTELPVTERRLQLPGVSTAVLEGGVGPRIVLQHGLGRAIRLGIAESASARYGWPLRVIDDAGDDPRLERPGAFLEALRAVPDDGLPSRREAWTP